MCGIIGILSHSADQDVVADAVEALRRLEYRGYDSAGLAVCAEAGISRVRATGKFAELEARLAETPLAGHQVIGHTRWATHGAPTTANAHPHHAGRVYVVHNGIIENHKALREQLAKDGVSSYESETDTEVIAHLMQFHIDRGKDPVAAFHKTVDQLEGAFALAVMVEGLPGVLMGARRGSPLVAGGKDGQLYLCSDAIGLSGLTDQIVHLEEGDRVLLHSGQVHVTTEDGNIVARRIHQTDVRQAPISKDGYRHFMLKEIHEQPEVIRSLLARYVDYGERAISLGLDGAMLTDVSQVTLVACGTSFYAARVAQYWIESVARIPVRTEIASEFRYGDCVIPDGGLCIFISQSGETADTLAALKHAKSMGQRTLGLVNVATSSIAREADLLLEIGAGPEIGVASTKAFTCQLMVLAILTLELARTHKAIASEVLQQHLSSIREIPQQLTHILTSLERDGELDAIAERLAKAHYILFVGRGTLLPIALEGALKLKEITYIPAEGYAAGELKHGPISLVDEHVPVIGLLSSSGHSTKTQSNLEEIMARGGQVNLVADHSPEIDGADALLKMPEGGVLSSPILMTIPVQLLAYHTAIRKGTDVDQPRNLAKSVTVE